MQPSFVSILHYLKNSPKSIILQLCEWAKRARKKGENYPCFFLQKEESFGKSQLFNGATFGLIFQTMMGAWASRIHFYK